MYDFTHVFNMLLNITEVSVIILSNALFFLFIVFFFTGDVILYALRMRVCALLQQGRPLIHIPELNIGVISLVDFKFLVIIYHVVQAGLHHLLERDGLNIILLLALASLRFFLESGVYREDHMKVANCYI